MMPKRGVPLWILTRVADRLVYYPRQRTGGLKSMRHPLPAIVLLLCAAPAAALRTAVTADGQKIPVFDDGTWRGQAR